MKTLTMNIKTIMTAALLTVGALSSQIAFANQATQQHDAQSQVSSVKNAALQVSPLLGSGYDDLRGSIVDYGYDDFDNFNLEIYNQKIRWTGQVGYFEGVTYEATPIISKINDHVYFLSWPTGKIDSDNVIYNLNTKTVNAHLSLFNQIMGIHGHIYKINTPDAQLPASKLTALKNIHPLMVKNQTTKKLIGLDDPKGLLASDFAEDKQARKELQGLEIDYKTPQGMTHIEVGQSSTLVRENGLSGVHYKTHATKIEDGVYYVSWNNKVIPNHIVINTKTKQVFDQVSATGKRIESIYDLAYFGQIK